MGKIVFSVDEKGQKRYPVTVGDAVVVDGKTLTKRLAEKQEKIDQDSKLPASNISGLSTVATSGSYNDLSNKPTIPVAVSETTVKGWGFAKKVKLNGEEKAPDANGLVDLGTIKSITVSDTYDPNSSNAMSGKAVAGALASMKSYGEVELSGELTYADNVSKDGATLSPLTVPTYSQLVTSIGTGTSETITSGALVEYSINGTGFSINSSTGVVTVAANTGNKRSAVVTMKVTLNGKVATATATINQMAAGVDKSLLDAVGVAILDVDDLLYATVDAWVAAGKPTPNGIAMSDGTHRFCISLKDIPGYYNNSSNQPYSCYGGYNTTVSGILTTTNNSTAEGDFAGKSNTDQIVAQIKSSDGYFKVSPWSAAGLCRQFQFPNGKYGYLGALGEYKIWQNKRTAVDTLLNGLSSNGVTATATTNNWYWSSTQYSATNAWAWNFNGSYSGSYDKDNGFYVRAFVAL